MKEDLTSQKLDELISDEKKGAKEYHKLGLHKLEADEKRHAEELKKLKKSKLIVVAPKRMKIDGLDYFHGATFKGQAQAHTVGNDWKRHGEINSYRVIKGKPIRHGYLYHLYVR